MMLFPHLPTIASTTVITVAAALSLAGSVATHALLSQQDPPTFGSEAVLIISAVVTLVTAITVMVGSLAGLLKVISELKKISANQEAAAVQATSTHALVNSLSEERVKSARAEGVTEGVAQEKTDVAASDAAKVSIALAVAEGIEHERERAAVPVPVVPPAPVPSLAPSDAVLGKVEVVIANPDPIPVIESGTDPEDKPKP